MLLAQALQRLRFQKSTAWLNLQDVARAMELANEMRLRNIERNVHTYTALMNVCIKCGKCPLALDTYHHMRQDGCLPNVVTYNTLIDVYGKMGQWDHAVKVLSTMKAEVSLSAYLHALHKQYLTL